MSTEAYWVQKLNKQTPLSGVYSFGTTGTNVNGVPDRYYEGKLRMLWIEFKHIKKKTLSFNALKKITPLQRAWLIRNYEAGHKPMVIVGVGTTQGFILDLPRDWARMWKPEDYSKHLMSIQDIATTIKRHVNGTR